MVDSLTAQLRWGEDGQPVSTQFDDVYFSRENGLQESRYVFLQHNQLTERFAALQPGQSFVIGETGFGTGLNFLCSWQLWRQCAPPDAHLHFVSVERYPLTRNDLERALDIWPELGILSRRLVEHYPPVSIRGLHRLTMAPNVHLTLIFDEACAGLLQLLPSTVCGPNVTSRVTGWSAVEIRPRRVDAWFLDGFAPARNPEMWRQTLFDMLARLSQPGTTLATFTAAGIVRRGLTECGFVMNKVPGYGSKREMLAGVFADATASTLSAAELTADRVSENPEASWHLSDTSIAPVRTVAVIGGGLAGCHSAHALARRGFKVTVIEGETPGTGGSGNAQGILYTKLSATPGALAEFNVHALLYARQFYRNHGLFESAGDSCGLLQVATTVQQEAIYQQIADRYGDNSLVRWLNDTQASEQAGVKLHYGALQMPGNGWLRPPLLCTTLLEHPNICTLNHTQVHSLQYQGSAWQLFDATGTLLLDADAVIIACATATTDLEQCRHFPLKGIPGQVSHVCATAASHRLRTVLCGNSYIAPAIGNRHCLGATFRVRSNNLEVTDTDHQKNLHQTSLLSPDLEGFTVDPSMPGRVGVRCTTPDYLPLAGPVARFENMQERFAHYRFNAKSVIDEPGDYWPGLFVNTGHGSKGLTYTPICAELIAAMLCGEPLPLSRSHALNLHPARFQIRALRRNQ